MKCSIIHKLFLVGIVLISNFGNAQKISSDEENELNFQTYFFEALKQKGIENYEKAIESLEKCHEIDSTNVAVYFEFSKNHFLLNNHYEAEIFIDKALETAPNNIYLLKHKVAIYKSQRNFQNAIDIQKKIIQNQPQHSDELVLLYIQNKNFQKAEELIAEIEEKALKTSRINRFKRYLKNRKSPSEKVNNSPSTVKNKNIETLKKVFTEKKDYKILQEVLILEQTNELFELVNDDSREGLELFPAQPFLYKMNGIALNKLGKYNEAINVLTIGIDFVVDNNTMEADFYEQLSISYEGLNNKNSALKFRQKAKQLRQNE